MNQAYNVSSAPKTTTFQMRMNPEIKQRAGKIDAEEAKQLVEYDAIMKDEQLASLLGMQDSFKPEDEPDLERIKALLERFETETDLNRNDVFYGVFQLIMKSKDEDITLGKIANLMEVLLYLVLNGGLDQDE